MRHKFTGLTFAAILVGGIGRVSVAGPTIYPLGIPDGSVASRGYSINSSGQVAVSSVQLFGQGTASRYDGTPGAGGVLRNLGTLPGYQTSFAYGVNESGQVAGYAQGATTVTPTRAFLYNGTPGAGGVMSDLGTLGGVSSRALAINNLGQMTGDAETDPSGPNSGSYAFIYTGTPGAGGTMKSLGSLGGPGSVGLAINNPGQIAGYSPTSDGSLHPFRYDGVPGTGGVMHDLGLLNGYATGAGFAINASGSVVGEMDDADGNFTRGFLYKGTPGVNGVMTELSLLPGGSYGSAASINDAGYVLGISDRNGDLTFHPVLWRPDGSVIDLEAWFNAENPAQAALWDFSNPYLTSINNNGLITGDAVYLGSGPDNGHSVAFVMDAGSLVPEPSSLTLLLGAVLLLRRRR
jgi:probable HAF family extracellular repeat protein